MYCVYKHICPNTKIYISITGKDPIKRWANGYGYKNNKHFYSAILKYGLDNIRHEILFKDLTKEEACAKEIELIAKCKSNQREFGYNKSSGGEYNCGFNFHQTDETKLKISNALKGIKRSAETCRKIGEAHKGNKNFLGKHHTEETRKKISEKTKARMINIEPCDNFKYVHKSKPAHNRKCVICIKTNEKFNSLLDAELKHNISRTHICNVCKGKRKSAGGYHWRYADDGGRPLET